MADLSDFWFWLLLLGFAVGGGGWLAFRSMHVARLIEDTPTSRIRSAAQGYVELAGRCRPLDGTQNLAPLTQRPCVWWSFRIQRKVESGSGKNRRQSWRTVQSGTSAQPFLLDDGTGECVVQPDGAEVLVGESTTWYGSTPWPAPPTGGNTLNFGSREYRYFEQRIYEHERLCLLGQFATHDAESGRDRPAEVAALLAEWKQDPAALKERFDHDRDGEVSLAEWERARAEAKRTVDERQPAPSTRTALHLLRRPDGGQLFLIAAFPEGDVAKRYRRRALLAFVGFVAATYALGWLLQGVFG